MTKFKANASVVFTDKDGKQIDTFVIFDTDEVTGLTQINHKNLRVGMESLAVHSKTVGLYHMPLADAFSFEMLNKLKAKYAKIDAERKTLPIKTERQNSLMYLLANAS
ncbi:MULTISPECIES: hypothetical protein [unclassified Mucilaginibacter]|uniref:hypothetical protein n=1 Tax=unclassified Mucilaginibacter TaxID=2617802 RepID=UPI002AC8E5AF|nr:MULTISPECIES: hypothetical protein [unclassified Mucilaginibacter]MEB0261591.1 hypothetical protein [Mucilaginibacter sp. 10I4]MEB0277155.1 hypothetical protein [Mucilaginibacter sp. 10B2]MEB0301399.1 hypothetical protein [Mucilaginibacter sp. 5C4]WPX25255.1 hypothetical protein RHM67_08240 [Mucilaginibacter sp. 5C4]